MIKIHGKKYILEVDLYAANETDDYCFSIKAICKLTGRFSCINNLTTVLSELGVDPDDPHFLDSKWVVTEDESRKFVNSAKDFLSDSCFLNYLEDRLDEDRGTGEWENVLHI